MDRPTLIEFPSDFPLKIMGLAVEGFAQEIAELVVRHAPEFESASMEMRPSKTGKYLSLTCIVRATSQAQLDGLYVALTVHPMVKVVL